jgi:YVTN family beta-propeller protein
LAEIKVGERPYAVALAQGKGFVTDQYGGTLTVFDAASYAVLGKITVAQYPEGIEASADGRYIYVANWFDNKFMKIDAISQKIEASVETGDGPRAFGTFIRQK